MITTMSGSSFTDDQDAELVHPRVVRLHYLLGLAAGVEVVVRAVLVVDHQDVVRDGPVDVDLEGTLALVLHVAREKGLRVAKAHHRDEKVPAGGKTVGKPRRGRRPRRLRHRWLCRPGKLRRG